ncbi:3-hydroxyacyl-ACP dehydratase FabZ family protein [Jeotgalibacillus proteolyticus]|uniref:3-hydroxyacyl-[acyl-carrier-protein] dehydratase FabZ n=1 Tax=Jeotgalibacillus proteolyticus TaxID=2082395 RepID=A0A2S5G732_9BACL|nr:hypothetical protein [Jeotgalibacillus proteolyticus]PPA68715.1 hypothetical protein C4B60_19285 [Jeotgalibacillus proteolyticus]PPA68792.1 hypothetical protein C4B60_19715 [Jeotgalibacillus proteolyticus]
MYNSDVITEVLPMGREAILLDRVTEVEPGKMGRGIKNITITELPFKGDKRTKPNYPEAMLAETIGQLGVFIHLIHPENRGKSTVLAKIKDFEFFNHVYPGDQVELTYEVIKKRETSGLGIGTASVNGVLIAQGEMIHFWE